MNFMKPFAKLVHAGGPLVEHQLHPPAGVAVVAVVHRDPRPKGEPLEPRGEVPLLARDDLLGARAGDGRPDVDLRFRHGPLVAACAALDT